MPMPKPVFGNPFVDPYACLWDEHENNNLDNTEAKEEILALQQLFKAFDIAFNIEAMSGLFDFHPVNPGQQMFFT